MKTRLAKKIILLFIVAAGVSGFSFAHAVDISLSIPTQNGNNPCASPTATTCYPGTYVNTFYQFALMIGGIIAFGAIVFGGVKYMTSAGNP
ncbi:MAG TPA: hypothetical protein VNV63_01675, partial [Nitrospiria bacterium]|nr:hypothetical protein [Nitrospiria bacterium]